MKKQICIVGGGVIGLACAYYLTKRGHKVCLIERNSIGESCAKGNAGYVSPSHFVPLAAPGMIKQGLLWMFNRQSPFYLHPRWDKELIGWLWKFNAFCTDHHVQSSQSILANLCLQSLQLYQQLDQQLPQKFELKQNGIVVLSRTQKDLDKELKLLESAEKLGLQAQYLSPDTLHLQHPELNFDVKGGVFYSQDSHLEPFQLMQSLHQSLLTQGVEIIEHCTIDRVQQSNQQILSIGSAERSFEFDELIIAAGCWSAPVMQMFGLKVPIQAGKGYSVTIEKPWQIDTPFILNEARVAVTPFDKKLRFAGTMEFAGLDLSIEQNRVSGILTSVKKYFPEFQTRWVDNTKAWAGLRPCSPDGLPLIGRINRFQNLILATGHAMLGLTLAPITGSIVADICEKNPLPISAALSPERFS